MPNKSLKHPAKTLGIAALTPTYERQHPSGKDVPGP
ncbi:hypothetical protein HDE77_002542 [Rhodanobacter sp. MP7CTX1]|nr:hypothetical protein [Rhodanobacter sp. MP7CTX1]